MSLYEPPNPLIRPSHIWLAYGCVAFWLLTYWAVTEWAT